MPKEHEREVFVETINLLHVDFICISLSTLIIKDPY